MFHINKDILSYSKRDHKSEQDFKITCFNEVRDHKAFVDHTSTRTMHLLCGEGRSLWSDIIIYNFLPFLLTRFLTKHTKKLYFTYIFLDI